MSDPRRFARLQELFHELVDLDAASRGARLEDLDHEAPDLAEELRELLGDDTRISGEIEARERALEALADTPEAGLDAGWSAEASPAEAERVGSRVGPYRVVRLLGEGGMGRVYEAEQSEPLVRRVAVKVLRLGLGSRDVLDRFEAERQALAVMSHPHIARMLDAGTTAEGMPWFAMELVEGVSITRWAEEQGLDLEARIEVLLPVCDAVQHAHSKGVIHRDLKPSNILVARDDEGRPVPKVIDFGIAKALDRPLLARTLATRLGELVGTPEYMSPEQATLGAVDVDTRSDVYALGLVLYELLVGELPLPAKKLRGLAFDQICRHIREEPAPRPSLRLGNRRGGSRNPRTPASGSSRRRLRGELDAVLLQALAKDRERRYGSPAALADDLRRFLRHEAVTAATPSFTYRAGKFLRRHRAASILASLALVSLLAGLATATLGLVEARRAEERAVVAREEALGALRTSEETTDFVVRLFEAQDPRTNPGLDLTAADLLDRAVTRIDELDGEPAVQARLLETLGEVSWSLGAFDRAEPLLERALELRRGKVPDPRQQAQILTRLAGLDRDRGELGTAEERLRLALGLLGAAGLDESAEMGSAANSLGIVLSRARRFDEAAEALEQSLEVLEALGEEGSVNMASGLANLAAVHQRSGRLEQALERHRRALALFEELLPENHPNLATLHVNLSITARGLGRLGEALRHSRRALEIDRETLPPEHPGLAATLHGLGAVHMRLGHFEPAREAFEEALDVLHRALGPDSFASTLHRASLGRLALAEGDPTTALRRLEPVIDQLTASDNPRASHHLIGYRRTQASALLRLGRPEEARRAAELGSARVEPTGQTQEEASFRLLHALSAHDLGEQERATRRFAEALALAECRADAPCSLDRAESIVLRAHWHARRGETDAAFRALTLALDHRGWTAWMLDDPDLEPLRGDPRFRRLEETLETAVRAALEHAETGPSRGSHPLGERPRPE